MTQPRILVVEDNPADVELLRQALGGAGVEAEMTVIDDGAAAVALFQNNDLDDLPDLAIIDLNLPRRNGLEILDAISANPRVASIPTIVLTSSFSARDREKTERFKIARFIVKPSDLDDFLRIGWDVREVLSARNGGRAE